MKGVPQFLIPQSENDKLLFRRYNIYYKLIFSIQT